MGEPKLLTDTPDPNPAGGTPLRSAFRNSFVILQAMARDGIQALAFRNFLSDYGCQVITEFLDRDASRSSW